MARTGPTPRADETRLALGCRVLLGALIVVTALPEALLSLADAGLVGSRLWRPMAYQYGAFWSGLLGNWRPNYALQPEVMFLSYALLHAGPAHLLGNLVVLFWMGGELCRRQGPARMAAIYVGAAIGGAVFYGTLASSYQPMVGASGAIFGLAGALTPPIGTPGPERRRAAIWVLFVVGLNVLTFVVESGALAWQAHLGGFVTGFGLSRLIGKGNSGNDAYQPKRSF